VYASNFRIPNRSQRFSFDPFTLALTPRTFRLPDSPALTHRRRSELELEEEQASGSVEPAILLRVEASPSTFVEFFRSIKFEIAVGRLYCIVQLIIQVVCLSMRSASVL
jgi:hypothetical protein